MKPRSQCGSETRAFVAAILVLAVAPLAAQTTRIWVGPNVNMVSGTTWPDGDPFLQRQNEPSIAVSTRNPLHLLAGVNDYRTVDLPGLPEGKETGDAWLGLFRSTDGGGSWKSTLVRGYPQDQAWVSPPHGYEAAADPVVRAGTHGLFYYSGIVFDRSLLRSAAFVARLMDLNNETLEPVRYVDTVLVDSFENGGAFIDKPWLETDIPRAGAQTVTLEVPQGNSTVSQTVPCGNVYMAWAEITGQGAALRTRIMFSRSTDCGGTWSTPIPLSLSGANGVGLTVAQGATIAVAPATGRVYVAWRQFRSAAPSCTQEKGFWKNSPGAWPVETLVVGGVTYTKQQAIVILSKTYPPSDAPGILAQQLIAAKLNVSPLNVYSGADNVAIEQVIAAADAWLVAHPLGSKPSPAEKQAGLALKNQLEAFNKGLAGTAACSVALTPYPDAILVAHSDDSGQTFTTPGQVATVSPFDQGTSEYSFRTNAYPTMAIDATNRAYLAWATRGLATPNVDPVAGDARIVVTTSNDGATWTAPQPIDQPALPGHQLFPSLTFNAGKLMLVYNDYRADASGVFERFVVDLLDATHPMRHTVDVRAAIADPAAVPVFTDYSLLKPSDQVSRYPFIVMGTAAADATALQLQYNPPNLPMFELGHKPFFGDYHDVAGAPRFVPDANGGWVFNTAPSTAPVFHAVWTDNRDVVGPPDGDWSNYVPPGEGHTSLFDGSTPVPTCESVTGGADRTQMRNQNVYTARLMSGLFVAVPSNTRPLSPEFQRTFVIFVQNATDAARQFQLQILNQPVGGTASFQQFGPVVGVIPSVSIAAYSSISQAVFVTSSERAASVDVRVTELNCGSSCLRSTVRINPDSSNPPPADDTLLDGEVYNPAVLNPAVYNPAVYNPAVFNPAVFNPAVFNIDPNNPAVLNYDLGNPAVLNPAVFNPAVLNPAVFNPAVFNVDAFNNTVMNLAFLNPAVFNPAVLNPAVLNPAVFNPAVFNPAVLNPAVLNPAVFNPAVFHPAVLNPAVFNPAVFNTALTEGSVTEANFVAQNVGNTTAAYSFNLNLANQQLGLAYQLMIYRLYFVPVANGCELTEAAQQELLVNDLTPNLNASLFDPNGGDSFFLNPGEVAIATLRVVPDPTAQPPGDPSQFNLEDLSVSVVSKGVNSDAAALGDTQPPLAQILAPTLPPLVITTASLPDGSVGALYTIALTAAGGSGVRVWSAFGGLPPGLTVSPAGILAGTPTATGTFTFTVRVTDAAQLAQRELTLSVVSGPGPAVLVFTVQPSDSVAGQSIPPVRVEGTPTLLPGVPVTMTLGTSPCSAATLTGSTTVVTNASGVADFPALFLDSGGWGYTLTASLAADPTINGTSNAFNVEGFCDTGTGSTYRWRSSVTTLADGRVLIAGGMDSGGSLLNTAEIYDPSTGVFTPTAGTMSVARNEHRGVLLPSGKVLIVGGYQSLTPPGVTTTVGELFDPAGGGTFTPTSGSLSTGRVLFTASWVPAAGKVLIAGGGTGVITASAEVYDPATDAFAPTGSMNTERSTHTATLLDTGKVIVVGGASNSGTSLASAELWDPTTGLFTPTGSLAQARQQHGAAKLLDGTVLLLGGISYPGGGPGSVLSGAEVYDPATEVFSPTGSLTTGRFDFAVAPLPSGKALAVGGENGDWLQTAEVFDPATGAFTPTADSLLTPYDGQASPLPAGTVLIVSYDNLHPAQLFFPLPPTIFLVTNTNDSGPGSLRQAMLDANAHPGLDAIHFAIPGAGVQTISPMSALPVVTDPVLLDATTQPSYSGTPLIRIDGAAIPDWRNGLQIGASGSVVRGFVITRFLNTGILVSGVSSTHVENNYVGTDGSAAAGNGQGGIFINLGAGNVIHGNVISGNGSSGILLFYGAKNTTVTDNLIGTNAAGAAAVANTYAGIYLHDTETTLNTIANNVCSGNGSVGISVSTGTHHNTIRGNLIGSDATGTLRVPNGLDGIDIGDGAHHNVVGGTTPGAANTIVANGGSGIGITSPQNTVLGNWIGTNSTMATALGNDQNGVITFAAAADNTIGGTAPGERNVIAYNSRTGVEDQGTGTQIVGNLVSGNAAHGVTLFESTNATVSDNRIGTDPTGMSVLANVGMGLYIDTSTASTVRRNLISGNGEAGIWLVAASGHVVAGNLIGTNAAGTSSLPNAWCCGIGMWDATDNVIGGAASEDSNLISGNAGQGVGLYHGCTGNTVSHNRIGTNLAGTAAVPNTGIGADLQDATTINNTVSGNLISGNGSNGITVESGATATSITGNLVGLNAAATAPLSNNGDGIASYGANQTTVADNIVGASTYNGIRLLNAAATTIRHNWVGTNPALTAGLGNGNQGVSVATSSGTTIGGPAAGDGNIVALNTDGGILLEGGATNTQILGNVVSGNTDNGIGVLDSQTVNISGNKVGTNPAGTGAWANTANGISVSGATTTGITIRDNLISGNGQYGLILSDAPGSVIKGNLIGTDITGIVDLGNQSNGVRINSANNTTIGGPAAGERNVMSGNSSGLVLSNVQGSTVEGNFIGTNSTATAALENHGWGAFLDGSLTTGNTVKGNVFSGNHLGGIVLGTFSHNNTVIGNAIGVDVTRSVALPNNYGGLILSQTSDNTVGGASPGEGNVISGNNLWGVDIDYGSTGNAVVGNWIGTNPALASGLGNAYSGVSIDQNSLNNLIGGTADGAGNVIAHNSQFGVEVLSGTGNAILANSIFGNGWGILNAAVLVNSPGISSAVDDGSATVVSGSVYLGTPTPGVTLFVQFFANSTCAHGGYGEGETFLQTISVVTDTGGIGHFGVSLPPGLLGKVITATTSTLLGPGGDTSEFSTCITVVGP